MDNEDQIPPPSFGKLRMVSLSNYLQRENLPLFGKEGRGEIF
jgi:hypothetical protein